MTPRRARGISSAVLVAASLFLPAVSVWAQTVPTLRVVRRAPVYMDPRGDSLLLGMADAGQELEIIGAQPGWYGVVTPAGMRRPRGWIPASAVQILRPLPGAPDMSARPGAARPKPAGRLMIRAFGQAGGARFAADDTFDAILGTPFLGALGAGVEVVLPNGAFVRGSADRYRKTGSLVLVSGTQFFTLAEPDIVTVMPIQFTVGYRDPAARRAVPYFGVGAGWHTLRERATPLADATEGHVGYHALGGAEFPFGRFLSLAAEAQWAAVPKSLGTTGLSAAFEEKDLGGVSVRFRVIVGY